MSTDNEPAGRVPLPGRQGEPAAEEETRAAQTVVMPGNAEESAEEIAQVSPERRPADARVGPAGVSWMIIGTFALLFAASLISAIWIGWAAAIAAFMIALMGLFFFNPVMGAASQRIEDRKEAVKHHAQGEAPAGMNHDSSQSH